MKKLNYHAGNSIDFFDTVVEAKNVTQDDPDYKDRIAVLRDQIKGCFDEYDSLFESNQLINAVSAGFVNPNRADLLKLYSYKRKTFQKLKIEVTTLENNRKVDSCQNCTINSINSFDHYLPKEQFSEFSVHPRNLIPSCTECNGHKSIIWKDVNSLLFLNHYLDDLPVEQYLFVNITADGDTFKTEFYLENRNNIDADLFNVISSHYRRLELTKRFAERSDGTVTELENLVEAQRFHLSREDMVSTVGLKIAKDKVSFGHNYWKAILQEELINNDVFMNRFFL